MEGSKKTVDALSYPIGVANWIFRFNRVFLFINRKRADISFVLSKKCLETLLKDNLSQSGVIFHCCSMTV